MTAGAGRTRTEFDAVVVGAGAAGSLAAYELTRAGLRVALLDAGPEIDATSPGSTAVPRDRGLLDRALIAATGQPVQARCFACTRLTRHLYVDDRENPYTTADATRFNWFRGRQVGGRLHTWGRVVPRFSDWEFRPTSHGGAGPDWPIGYADLAPFYSRVERLLGVHGSVERLPQRPDGEFIEPRPLTAAERHVSDAVAAQWPSRRFAPAPVVQYRPDPMPLPLRAAMATGNLTLRSNAVVTQVVTDPDGRRARGVALVGRHHRGSEEIRGRIIILCASAIETVRLLLHSKCARHPAGLGNSSGLLGRYLMDHCMTGISGELPGRWPGATSGAPEAHDPHDLASAYVYMPGFRNITEQAPSGYEGSFSMLGAFGRRGSGFFLMAFGDMQPSPANDVQLDPQHRDPWGVPAARIRCVHRASDQALVADMVRVLGEIAVAGGLRVRASLGTTTTLKQRAAYSILWKHVVTPYGAFHPGGAIHEMGGARMGDDPRSSVLNRYNQSWDVKNLFVTDGACFVRSGHQSHTLTIMALTLRACEYAVSQLQSGDV
jgi:choline dehydrogenase-like flavoprotein